MKIKVATTSTACLDYYDQDHNIDIVRIKLIVDDNELLDGLDIQAPEFYEKLRANPEWIPKTSTPSIGEVVNYFEDLIEQGYTECFITTLSSHLSGTHNTIYQAGQIVKDKLKVTVYDTKTVCFSEGHFALTASRLFDEGKTLEEVVSHLDVMKDNNTIFFAVDSLNQLVNNGRLSGAQAFFGKLLKIKPILEVQGTGEIIAVEKTRNIKKALKMIANKVKDYTKGRKYFAHILYAGESELKEYFLETLKDELGLENLYEAPSTPVVGAHIGPDVIGIGIFLE